MEALISTLIGLIPGVIGGNVAGALFKNLSLGTLGNSVCGVLGGGLGSTIFGMLGMGGMGGGEAGIMPLVMSILSGGVGGGALMAIVGFIRKATAKAA